MKFNGVLIIILGTILIISTLGLFKEGVNLLLIGIAIVLMVYGLSIFAKANRPTEENQN